MANPIKQFVIKPIVPIEFAGVDISFTNSSLWMVIAAIVSITFLTLATSRRAMVPGRLQMIAEISYDFIANIIKDNIGSHGRQYFPFVFTLFMIVFFGNVLGLIPYSFTYTSHIAVTGALALIVFTVITIYGFAINGLGFLKLFAPSGIPLPLMIIVIPIELLSFLMRPFTLSVRLFANMMAGHMVLKIFAGFAAMAVSALGFAGLSIAVLPVGINIAMLCLELLIGALQAYVFVILTCVYLKDTVDVHH